MGLASGVPLCLDPLYEFWGSLQNRFLFCTSATSVKSPWNRVCPAFWQELGKGSHTAVCMVHISTVRQAGLLTSNQLPNVFPFSVDWDSQDTTVQHKARFVEPSALAWKAGVCSCATLVLLQSRCILLLMSIKYAVLRTVP